MLGRLRGQYAFALHDARRNLVILARDRVGIVPLHWTRQGDRLYFCSEIKGLLASGHVPREVDWRGVDHLFTFFSQPGPRTCFKNISALPPGSFLSIPLRESDEPAEIRERVYWDFDFPDAGDEYDPGEKRLIEEFGGAFDHATAIRLRGDVPVASYLSGGIDSATVMATAARIQGSAPPSFTIEIPRPTMNELEGARAVADAAGSRLSVVTCGGDVVAEVYPALVSACDAPVMVTSCAAMWCLAREVRRQGYKAALTGEGSDEVLAGYSWLKVNRLMSCMDRGDFRPGDLLRRAGLGLGAPHLRWPVVKGLLDTVGGAHGIVDLYGLVSMSRDRFYSRSMVAELDGHHAFLDLRLNLERMARWHPLNKGLYLGCKTMLPGLLMSQKGDRPAMAHAVETRYPFLDEEFMAFCAKIHPRWKLRGLVKDKYLLRRYARGFLPRSITDRSKALFQAPLDRGFFANPPAYVRQLLSPESLARTGCFDAAAVQQAARNRESPPGLGRIMEMGLTGVMATQLWHHLYMGGGLCELPTWSPDHRTLSV